MRLHSLTLGSWLLVACAKPGTGTASSGGSGSSGTVNDSACSGAALGLGSARQLEAWKPPAGCAPASAGAGSPQFLRTAAELEAAFKCTAESPGIDVAQHTLVVSQRTLSPAAMGTTVFDDGKVVTFVERSRRNCPNEPLPMPMSYTLYFLLPAGAQRDFKQLTCTLETRCD